MDTARSCTRNSLQERLAHCRPCGMVSSTSREFLQHSWLAAPASCAFPPAPLGALSRASLLVPSLSDVPHPQILTCFQSDLHTSSSEQDTSWLSTSLLSGVRP